MYETSDFKRGLFIEVDGIPFQVSEFQHVKPGKGNSFTRTKLRNLINGNLLDRTFKSGEKVGVPELERKGMQYLYKDNNGYQFMDMTSFDQIFLDEKQVGEKKGYLIENLEIEVLYFKGRPIEIQLPTFVVLKVDYTEPGIKGDTVSGGGGKPATMHTGLVTSVPLHVKPGDMLKIDTRDASYVEKIK